MIFKISFKATDAIKELAEKHGLSDVDLACHLGVSTRTIARWKKGEAEPKSRLISMTIHNFKKSIENQTNEQLVVLA